MVYLASKYDWPINYFSFIADVVRTWIKKRKTKTLYFSILVFILVPRTRLELAHRCRHYPLKVACLPISPSGLFWEHKDNTLFENLKEIQKKILTLHKS